MLNRFSSPRVAAIVLFACWSFKPSSPPPVINAQGFDGVALCAPLRTVTSRFPSAVDTTFEAEMTTWPAKLLRMPDGGDVVFESSWGDTMTIWRISTTSSGVITTKGYAVGNTIARLRAAHEPMDLEIAEGALLIDLPNEGVAIQVDSVTSQRFYSRFNMRSKPDVKLIEGSGRIVAIATGKNCNTR